jgi:hypothetical protein
MVALAGTPKERKKKLAAMRKPFANRMSMAQVQLHATNLQVRMDRRKAEEANRYRLEYNNIVGRANRAGATADNLAAIARRNFVATHSERHLPK